jgi:hypothetical protein
VAWIFLEKKVSERRRGSNVQKEIGLSCIKITPSTCSLMHDLHCVVTDY